MGKIDIRSKSIFGVKIIRRKDIFERRVYLGKGIVGRWVYFGDRRIEYRFWGRSVFGRFLSDRGGVWS